MANIKWTPMKKKVRRMLKTWSTFDGCANARHVVVENLLGPQTRGRAARMAAAAATRGSSIYYFFLRPSVRLESSSSASRRLIQRSHTHDLQTSTHFNENKAFSKALGTQSSTLM
uniref:Uncharacterized protein n=1 Tax=Oryza barthii TaxID=65489 RepID=A0A679BD98_9ORYZ|nr:hypothetical protein [Oryza barthii]